MQLAIAKRATTECRAPIRRRHAKYPGTISKNQERFNIASKTLIRLRQEPVCQDLQIACARRRAKQTLVECDPPVKSRICLMQIETEKDLSHDNFPTPRNAHTDFAPVLPGYGGGSRYAFGRPVVQAAYRGLR